MRAIRRFIAMFGFGALAAATLFFALNYHFIFTDERIVVERKSELTLEDTIISTRGWGPKDYLSNPRISAILIKNKISR